MVTKLNHATYLSKLHQTIVQRQSEIIVHCIYSTYLETLYIPF